MTRNDIIGEAIESCLKELYEHAQPKVEWEDFVKQNKEYREGPRPYEFYYLPEKVLKSIVDNYISAYRIAPEVKETISALIEYLEKPIRKVYKDYEYYKPLSEVIGDDNFRTVLEYLEGASNFYRWDSDLQSFMFNIYLGASPNSNKQAVINNWKTYRNQDIIIDDSVYEDDYEF